MSEEMSFQDKLAVKGADYVELAVGVARDKVVVPAQTIAKWVVYGLVAGVLGTALFAMLSIAFIRAVVVYLPWGVWLPYLVLGVFFILLGTFLWSRRFKSPKS